MRRKSDFVLFEPPARSLLSSRTVHEAAHLPCLLAPRPFRQVLTFEVDTFSFTSHGVGKHDICFRNLASVEKRVNFEVQTDLAVKDYSDVVQKEHLRPLGLLFRRAEDKLSDISKEMEKSRDREAQLRDTNESTSNRIQWFSILSITVLLTISAWQMIYLRSFFRSKKLL